MKAIRAITYASAMAAGVAAALPAQGVTTEDRIGSSLQVVVPPGHMVAVPEGSPRSVVVVPSAAAGAGAPAIAATVPTVALDRGSVPDKAFVISTNGSPWINVDYGETVLFNVRDPNGTTKQVAWRFDGLDNVVSYADIDPQSTWAHNIRIFVNQSMNPTRNSGKGGDE